MAKKAAPRKAPKKSAKKSVPPKGARRFGPMRRFTSLDLTQTNEAPIANAFERPDR